MIVKVEFGRLECGLTNPEPEQPLHIRMIECDELHVEQFREPGEDGLEYYSIVCRKNKDIDTSIEIHLGKKSSDTVYIMENGKTVDKMYFPFFTNNKERF